MKNLQKLTVISILFLSIFSTHSLKAQSKIGLKGEAIIKASAMTLEALRGTDKAFLEEIQKVRPQKGQIIVAKKMMDLLKGSENIQKHRDCEKVQDAYTLRCTPQVLGPSLEAILYAEKIVSIELNSATDNPSGRCVPDRFFSRGH